MNVVLENHQDINSLESILSAMRSRLLVRFWLQTLSRITLIAVLLLTLFHALCLLQVVPQNNTIQAITYLAMFSLLITLTAIRAKRNIFPATKHNAAAIADNHYGLKQRLSSSVEFEAITLVNNNQLRFLSLQRDDAERHAQIVKPKEVIPYSVPWELVILIPAIAVLLFTSSVKEKTPVVTQSSKVTPQNEVIQAGKKLVRKAAILKRQAALHHLPQTNKMAQKIEKIGKAMSLGSVDKSTAVAQLRQLSAEIRKQQKAMGSAAATSLTKGTKVLNGQSRSTASREQSSQDSIGLQNAKQAVDQARATIEKSDATTSANSPVNTIKSSLNAKAAQNSKSPPKAVSAKAKALPGNPSIKGKATGKLIGHGGIGSSPKAGQSVNSEGKPHPITLSLPKPQTAGASLNGPTNQLRAGAGIGSDSSVVPTGAAIAAAKSSAEAAMNREDVPPSYRHDVLQYFNSIEHTGK